MKSTTSTKVSLKKGNRDSLSSSRVSDRSSFSAHDPDDIKSSKISLKNGNRDSLRSSRVSDRSSISGHNFENGEKFLDETHEETSKPFAKRKNIFDPKHEGKHKGEHTTEAVNENLAKRILNWCSENIDACRKTIGNADEKRTEVIMK